MIRKLLVTLVLALLLIFFIYPQKNSIISVFRMTDEPLVISKGHYGQSLIVEISFSHDGLLEWLKSLNKPYPLLMLDADWINRSPEIVELIKERNIPTGLLGGNGDKDYSIKKLNKELAVYEKHFNNKPLWFMTSDFEFPSELKQAVFNEQINLVSPSFIYTKGDNYQKSKGAIVSYQLSEQTKPNFKDLTKFMETQKFIPIEENIFGYSIKTRKMP